MSDNPNPYAQAAAAYGSTTTITDMRTLEATILLKSASKLETLAKQLRDGPKPKLEEIGDTLEYNQKLWQFFINGIRDESHPLPLEIKNNIATLGLFVFKRTMELLIDTTPEKIQALIDINRNIASGLMKKPAAEPKHAVPGILAAKAGDKKPAEPLPGDKKSTTDSMA
ncbi:MAG: flagellar biosynthesis regulator FlaF [Alphaproteobacteria bacterium]